MIVAGIDAGSRMVKVVLLDGRSLRVIGTGVVDQGVRQGARVSSLLGAVIRQSGCRRRDIRGIVATGYGRDSISDANATVTEITCHARGVTHLCPGARTVIDIGGQDSKILRLGEDGRVRDFVMNDRCAAGTGRFLEVVATRLDIPLANLGRKAAGVKKPASISSTCVVFAETEIVGLLAAGVKPGNIVAGVLAAMAKRIASMAGRDVAAPVVFTGGVALIPGMGKAMERALKTPVRVVPQPQLTGALGAALLAARPV